MDKEKSTPDKPELLEMSSILGIEDPDTVLGKLVRVWSWFDSNSENGHAPSVTNVLIDRVTGVRGFCDAMFSVGWLDKTEDGVIVPNYDRHLGKSAKKRALDAERKRRSRESHAPSVTNGVTEIGLDKIRVDKDNNVNKTKEKKSPSVALDYSPLGMTDEQISIIKAIKKRKRAVITQRVINSLAKEMHLAVSYGYTFDELLTEWESRGWTGFKAEWVKPSSDTKSAFQQTIENLESIDLVEPVGRIKYD